jgi:hypothetical protein
MVWGSPQLTGAGWVLLKSCTTECGLVNYDFASSSIEIVHFTTPIGQLISLLFWPFLDKFRQNAPLAFTSDLACAS